MSLTGKVAPADNVYSYFMFTPPIEQKKSPGRTTWATMMAYLLVLGGFFFQGILLFVIFNTVVGDDESWRASIMGPVNVNVLSDAPKDSCVKGNSLCFPSDKNGTFSCAPPSVQLTSRWEQLDMNNDGVWSREEAVQGKEDIMCRFGVDSLEVFEVFSNFLQKRSDVIWVHPDVQESKAIPKPYFTYAAGDIIMCGYRNEKMCPNLLKRGIFDTPLRDGVAPRIGTTTESAIEYCYELLKPGGICDRSLPSTYAAWKITSEQQCMDPSFSKYIYTHPGTGEEKSMLEVDYSARAEFENGRTSIRFFVYKCIILGVFFLAMFTELKDIVLAGTWVLRYPSATAFAPGDDVKVEPADPADPEGQQKYTIQGITQQHRMLCGILVLARLILTLTLTFVGGSFLLKQNDYIALLMDAVGLVFIIEIGCVLYAMVVQAALREEVEAAEPMMVATYTPGWLKETPAKADLVGGLVLVVFTVCVMYGYHLFVVEPMSHALECACTTTGDNCYEAQQFNTGFWDKYWSVDVPEVFRQVEQMKSGAKYSDVNFLLAHHSAPSGPAQPVIGSALKHRSRRHAGPRAEELQPEPSKPQMLNHYRASLAQAHVATTQATRHELESPALHATHSSVKEAAVQQASLMQQSSRSSLRVVTRK